MQRDCSGRPLRLFLTFYQPHRRLFALDLLFSLLSCLADLAFPYVSRQAMQHLLPLGLFRTFFAIMAALLAAYLLKAVFKYAVTVIGHQCGVLIEADMRQELFEHLQTMSFRFFDCNRTGVLMSLAVYRQPHLRVLFARVRLRHAAAASGYLRGEGGRVFAAAAVAAAARAPRGAAARQLTEQKYGKPPLRPERRFQLIKEPRRVSPQQRRKKVRSFSPATCAAEKIPLGLQTCAPSASDGQRVRCSQAANPFVKK